MYSSLVTIVPVNALLCYLLWGHMYSSVQSTCSHKRALADIHTAPLSSHCVCVCTSLCVCVCVRVCSPAGLTPSAPSCKQARSTDTSNLVQQFTGKVQTTDIGYTLHSWCDVFTNHLYRLGSTICPGLVHCGKGAGDSNCT